MSVQLKPKSDDPNEVNLTTISKNKINRSERVKDDLDQFFLEGNAQQKAVELGMPYINLYGYPIDTDILMKVSKEDVIRSKMGMFSRDGNVCMLTTPEPGHQYQDEVIQLIQKDGFKTKIYLCSSLSFDKLVKTYVL